MDYKNGKIYKLVSDETDKIYIGSTCSTLAKRMHQHKINFKRWQNGAHNNVSSYRLLEIGAVDIILIEDYPCENKNQLHARERYWIELNKNFILNQIIPTRTQKEYRQDNSIKLKEYDRSKYSRNQEKIKERSRKQYNENKEKIKETKNRKYNCECGGKYTHCHKALHLKTDKHQKYVKENITKV